MKGQSNSLTLNTATDGNLRIGTRTWTPAEYWQGEIAEVILYPANLSDEQRQRVEAYLKAKWGL